MTTNFNQEFYAWIKAEKIESLSSIGQCKLRVVEKEKEKEAAEKGSSTPALEEGWVASLALSVNEIVYLSPSFLVLLFFFLISLFFLFSSL